MISVLLSYLPLLAATLLIEVVLVAAAATRDRRRRAVTVCVAVNLLTHPMATLLGWRWQVDLLPLEMAVFLFEWLAYGQLLGIRLLPALRYALLPNAVTALLAFAMWLGGGM